MIRLSVLVQPYSMVQFWKITTSNTGAKNDNTLRVLEVDSICVGAVTGGGNTYIRNLNIRAGVELEVGLRAVLKCYTSDTHAVTSIEPKSLPCTTKYISPVRVSNWFCKLAKELKGEIITVGLVLGIFPLSLSMTCGWKLTWKGTRAQLVSLDIKSDDEVFFSIIKTLAGCVLAWHRMDE